MRLKTQLDGHECSLSLHRSGHTAKIEIDSRNYEVTVQELTAGRYLLLENTRVFDCRVAQPVRPGQPLEVTVGNRSYSVTLIDPKRLRTGHESSAHSTGAAEIVAPMPGRVARVLVDVGAVVEAGTGIIVVEAMKMQNEIKSPKAGVVVAINSTAGQTVNAGPVLAVIE